MQYLPHTNTLCLSYDELVLPTGFIPKGTYDSLKSRGNIVVHGRGGNGSPILIEFESLPAKYKALIEERYGNPYEYFSRQPLLKMVRPDIKARDFYAGHELPNGQPLPPKYQMEWTRQAEWLNMINVVLTDKRALKHELKITMDQFWDNVIILHQNDKPINPKLPTSRRRLTEKLREYNAQGYAALIDKTFGNQNTRKVSADIVGLLCSLYCQRNCRATLLQVAQDYNAFMTGQSTPVDLITGEVFQKEDFMVKGKIQTLAPATVKYYLNKKEAREIVDSFKLGDHDYTQKHKPHNRRKGPQYAFSMVSMDDYLPPFKTPDGKRTVWMYVIFDVASTAIVGVSYGTKKSQGLVDEALRDMARLCERKGWGLPMEMEIERSLNWSRRGSEENPDLFTEGKVFPFVRFAKANNSQEKRAEHFLKSIKYEELSNDEGFLGRPFGRNENYRLNRDVQETRYYTATLIKKLKGYVESYNKAPHPTADGLSRYEYLEQFQNPDAVKNNPAAIMPYIGFRTKTSIFRGDVEVQGQFYAAPADADVKQIGGRASVEAYWIPEVEGEAPSKIYLYQEGRYIGCADQIEQYQNARAERTDRDWELMGKQTGRQRAFEKKIEEKSQNLRLIGTVTPDEEGVIHVGVGYDKEAWEEEDESLLVPVVAGVNEASEALSTPQKEQKSSAKEGGYMQNLASSDEDYFSPAAIKSRAQQRI